MAFITRASFRVGIRYGESITLDDRSQGNSRRPGERPKWRAGTLSRKDKALLIEKIFTPTEAQLQHKLTDCDGKRHRRAEVFFIALHGKINNFITQVKQVGIDTQVLVPEYKEKSI